MNNGASESGAKQQTSQSSALELFKAYQESFVKLLLTRKPEVNRLTKIQFLSDIIEAQSSEVRGAGADTSAEGVVTEANLIEAAKLQAHFLMAYQLLDKSFTKKQEVIHEYISLVRETLQEKPITPENVKLAMKALGEGESPGTLFATFVSHCMHSLFVLEAIAYEVRYAKADSELTQDDLDIAHKLWLETEDARYKRLSDKVSGIMDKVKKWQSIIPQPLNDKEALERSQLYPFILNSDPEAEVETPEYRAERLKQVRGLDSSLRQAKAMAVAREAARTYAKAKEPFHKQHCELSDKDRLEMQFKLGIHPFSKSRQGYGELVFNAVTGHQSWLTKFEGAKLDPEMPVLYPERKALAAKTLLPFLQVRLDASKKRADESFKPEANTEDVDALLANLKKLKIGT